MEIDFDGWFVLAIVTLCVIMLLALIAAPKMDPHTLCNWGPEHNQCIDPY